MFLDKQQNKELQRRIEQFSFVLYSTVTDLARFRG